MTTARLSRILAVLALSAVVAACAKPLRKDQSAASTPISPDGGALASQSVDVRDENMTHTSDLVDVFFAYDSSRLSASTRGQLKKNAEWLKAHPSANVQVAGYCDARGTVEYNLALGQRRADAVRDYYVGLGVDGARVATISYGKERPTCSEANERCWSHERRGETLLGVRALASRGSRRSGAPR